MMNNIDTSMFYDIRDDLTQYPNLPIYVICGGRNTGKTYSTLRLCKEEKLRFCYMKRTDDDVALLCAGIDKNGSNATFDFNPFKQLNKDYGWNIQARKVFKGVGGFWNCDEDNNPVGPPIGYIVSLHKVAKVKGMDLTDCKMIIFDEFIPQSYEKVDKSEGIALLDFYKTVSRSNFILSGEVLPMVLLSNSTTVSCPITNEFEIVDDFVNMQMHHISTMYLDKRMMLLHLLEDKNGFREQAEQEPIYKAMAGTQWRDMALNNNFAYNDFTNVIHRSIKKARCLCKIIHKQKTYYVYVGDSGYYMTYKRSNTFTFTYNLNLENDQKRFYFEQVQDLQNACIDDRFKFETYEMYDLIMNYKSFYKVIR